MEGRKQANKKVGRNPPTISFHELLDDLLLCHQALKQNLGNGTALDSDCDASIGSGGRILACPVSAGES